MYRFALTLVALASSLAVAQVTINPTGGTSSANGIRVSIGNTGQMQVMRNGTGQFYPPGLMAAATTLTSLDNGVYLAVGNTVVGPKNFATWASTGVTLQEWTPVSNTLTPQANGSGTAVTRLRATVGTLAYELTVTWQYTFPNDFVTVTHSLVVPSGNTATLRLYHVTDAYLGDNDYGPTFFSLGPPTLVGGYRQAANIVEAWRYRSGIAWTGYYAGYYLCLYDADACDAGHNNSVNAAGTFTNYVQNPTSDVDNSFGIMWNFGSVAGTYTTTNDLTFYSYQPQLSKRFGTNGLAVGQSTSLTFTIDNVPGALAQTGMGFTDALPSGLVLANGTVSNTCGGSVTTAGGGALTAGSTSVRLTNGTLAGGVSRCTLSVTVTSSTAGAYVNGKANVTGTTVVENQVTDQVLSFVQGAPVVTVDNPGTINLGNAAAYGVSGTCQDAHGVVTVRVGGLSTTTPCSSNRYATTLAVTSLSDGASITVSASQTNAAGTGTDSRTTTKDTVAPPAPALTSPAAGAFLATATPTINGTGEVGATVRVFANGTEVCSAVVSPAGTWSCVSSTIANGAITLTARATDPAGNSGPLSASRTVTIDTVAPAAPSITNPAASATVAPNPAVSGTAEPEATVLVFEGTTQLCSTPASATGQWSCATSLGSGTHVVTARQEDRAGNQSPTSNGRAFVVANVPAVKLDAPGPINAANVTAFPVAGDCTTSAGSVTVRVSTVSTTTPCATARFSTTVNAVQLADGLTVVVVAEQTNVTGTGSDTRTTLKDTVAPVTPAVAGPAEGAFVNSPTPTFTGTGEAGSTVRVSRGGVELCSAVVTQAGTWACTPTALAEGSVVVTARAADGADNTSGVSPQRTFTIDVTAPGAPSIAAPAPGASVAPNPTLSGTAEAFATVSVTEGSALVCTVVADAVGTWSCVTALGSGPHVVSAKQMDRAGNASPSSASRSFTVQGPPTVLLNQPQDINAANAGSYVVTGACTTGAGAVTVTVGLQSTTTACASGAFSATLDVRALSDGAMVPVRASQTTAGGTGMDARTVTKDATAPANTEVTQPKTGAVTTSNQPAMEGTAEPGSTVTLYVDGNQVGTTRAGSTGTWQFTPTTPIADGSYTVTATATDAAGNEGAPSNGVRLTIDSLAPMAPVVVAPATGSTADSDRPLDVTGVAEAASTVVVFVDGKEVGRTTADAQGRFTVTLPADSLTAGSHTVEAQASDAAGNQSPKSAGVPFTVREVDARYAGKGVVGCTSAGGLPWLALAALALARRREVRR